MDYQDRNAKSMNRFLQSTNTQAVASALNLELF